MLTHGQKGLSNFVTTGLLPYWISLIDWRQKKANRNQFHLNYRRFTPSWNFELSNGNSTISYFAFYNVTKSALPEISFIASEAGLRIYRIFSPSLCFSNSQVKLSLWAPSRGCQTLKSGFNLKLPSLQQRSRWFLSSFDRPLKQTWNKMKGEILTRVLSAIKMKNGQPSQSAILVSTPDHSRQT